MKQRLLTNWASLLCFVTLVMITPGLARAQVKPVKIKLVKQAKVNQQIYATLVSSQHGVGLNMLGGMMIAPKPGYLLFDVQGANAYLNFKAGDEAGTWSGESVIKIDANLFKLIFGDGGYLWSKCSCPNVNDGCSLSITGGGDGPSYQCQGLECCKQKWGYIDKDGQGTVFN